MTRRAPLPSTLQHTPFRTSTAIALGASPSRLRGVDLDRSYWGIRSSVELKSLVDRCAAMQLRMPSNAFFSHSTAAQLLGAPVPWTLENADELHVTVPAPYRAPYAQRLIGHRTSSPVSAVTVRGVRISDPARTWCDLSTQLRLDHLVAAGDYLIHWRQPLLTTDDLVAAITTATNRRGLRRRLEALPLLDARAESAPESRLRVLLLSNGFTGLTINRHVEDQFGEFVARTDICIPGLKIVLEYMGDYHRTTPGQWRADMTRRSQIEAMGARVMELNADDLYDPRELVARIRALAALVPQ